MLEQSLSRLFVPWNIRSHDGTFVLGTIRSLEHSFPGTNGPWNIPENESYVEHSFLGPFVKRSRKRIPGTFVPRSDNTGD